MPITTLSLTRASLVWRPNLAIRLLGHGVITAVAYDGRNGILPGTPLPPVRFRRRARRGYEFITTPDADVADDGLLIATFEDVPPALGWVVSLTLTDTAEQARKVVDATFEAATAAFSLIPGMSALGGAAKVGQAIADVVLGIVGARVVGTWIGSESDAADLRCDWRAEHRQFKARFELAYDVQHDGPREDD